MVTVDPYLDAVLQDGSEPRLRSERRRQTRPHVLLVEDNVAVGESLSERLRREGYRVTWVQDGFHALASIEAHTPAAVVMDLMLPRMNGTASTRQIRWDYPDMPVIGISSLANVAMVQEFLAAGGTSFIDKRHMSPQLFDLLRSLLNEE